MRNALPSGRTSSSNIFPGEWAFVMENILNLFHNYYSTLPLREPRVDLSWLYCEDLVGFLDISPTEVWEAL